MERIFGIPRISDALLTRERLLRRLDETGDLTIVRGPAGAGKTVLVAEWASRSNRPGVWVTLRGSTALTPQEFWRQVLDRVSQAGHVPDQTFPHTESSTVRDPEELVTRTLRRLPDHYLIVVDRAGSMTTQACQSLLAVLAECPSVNCILLSRQTQFPVMTAQLTLDVNVIDVGELLLTDEELDAMLPADVRNLIPLSAAEIATAIGRLPIAARAAIISIRQATRAIRGSCDGVNAEQITQLVSRACRDLLLTSRLSPTHADFLRRTSLAPWLDTAFAAELAERSLPDAEAELELAEREGLGMWVPSPGWPTSHGRFVYSTAIQAALVYELRQSAPQLVERLTRQIAEWAQRRSDPMLAFQSWLELGELDRAAGTVGTHLGDFMNLLAPELVELLERVPAPRLQQYPLLMLPLAVTYALRDGANSGRARELLVLTVNAARMHQRSAPAAERTVLHTVASVALRIAGDLESAVVAADRSMSSLAELTIQQRDGLGAALAECLNQNGVTYLRAGRLEQVQRSLSTSFAITGPGRRQQTEFHALAIAAAANALSGDLIAAQRTIRRIEARWTVTQLPTWTTWPYRLATIIVAIEHLDFAAAREQLDAVADPRSSELGVPFETFQAVVEIAAGQPMEAFEDLAGFRRDDMGPVLSEPEKDLVQALQGLALHCAGHPQRAEQMLSRIRHQRWAKEFFDSLVALATDRPKEAMMILNALTERRSDPDDLWRTPLLGNKRLVLAACFLRLGSTELARTELETALEDLSRSQRRLPLIFLPASDLRALAKLAAETGMSASEDVFGDLGEIPDILRDVHQGIRLTDREQRVLEALARSGSVQAIAADLNVSVNTVRSHRRAIYRKLGVGSRIDAVLAGQSRGLISDAVDSADYLPSHSIPRRPDPHTIRNG